VTTKAPVAIVFDYEASWITRIQPQGADFLYYELAFRWYEAARRLGLDVDFVRPGGDLAGYRLVLAPSLPHVGEAALAAFAAADGEVLFGPRSGSKTRHFAIPDNLPPGPLASLIPMRVLEAASLRPAAVRWRERVEALGSTEAEAHFADGDPALLRAGRFAYLACWPNTDLLASVMASLAKRAALPIEALPDGVRWRRRGDWIFAFNYGDTIYKAPASATQFLLGGNEIEPSGVAIWSVPRSGAESAPGA
jgi:beta-galactosidase